MSTIKRLNILKERSRTLVNKMKSVNPLRSYDSDYVSTLGLTYTDIDDKLKKIDSCSSIIELKESFVQVGDTFEQKMSVAAANFCKQHTVCPICADRTQSRRRARFSDPIRKQVQKVERGERWAYIVTYTISDGSSLSNRIDQLRDGKKAFRLMGQKRGRERSIGEARRIKAGISTTEIKRGENSKEWHVHCHDLVFTNSPIDYTVYDQDKKRNLHKRYGRNIPKHELTKIALRTVPFNGEMVPVSKISEEWYKSTLGESISIDVSPIQHVPKNCNGKKKAKYKKMNFEESVLMQSREVLKYITKPSDSTPEDAVQILADTFNKRMVATYGEFRGTAGDDYKDPANSDSGTWVTCYDSDTGSYGDPQPGKYRDIAESEETTKVRSEAGKALGNYRRRRRSILNQRKEYGNELYKVLNQSKRMYKAEVNTLWAMHRQSITVNDRMTCEPGHDDCDKYSSVLALQGLWIPGSTRKDNYQAAFS